MSALKILAATSAAFVAAAASPCPAATPIGSTPTAREVMLLPAPPVQRFTARDGTALAYRVFTPPAGVAPRLVAIIYHGSAGSSRNVTLLGEALAADGVVAYAPDVRGQGLSGRRGDVDYIGQPSDDLADFIPVIRKAYPDARLALVGHSAGGGFVLRIAGEPLGRSFDRLVLISPYLGRAAPTGRPDAGWTKIDMPRMVLLAGLNTVGITAFNGATAIRFNLPPGAEAAGATGRWSYRMAMSYGPDGETRLFGPPAFREDAARARAPIVLIAGARDEQFYAERYAAAFKGLEDKVRVEIAPNADHMGALADPDALAMEVKAVEGEN